MLRGLALIVALIAEFGGLFGAAAVQAETPRAPRPLASAIEAMSAGRWERAAELAARDGQVASDLIEWHRLRTGKGSAPEALAFLRKHPDWPGLEYLRKRSERAFLGQSDADILTFFENDSPQTGAGALIFARALQNAGQNGDAQATLVLAWRTLKLTEKDQSDMLKIYPTLLKKHHEARYEMTYWDGLSKDRGRMTGLVSGATKRLDAARTAARRGANNAAALAAALPAELQDDAGLAYARFRRMMKKNQNTDAIALINKQSRIEGGLGVAGNWASWRRALARGQMRQGNYKAAYELAAVHGLREGSHYSDLEWLSGYLALRFLKEPELALDHFQRFRAAVFTPISLGRAGYWLGRAQEALGDAEAAKDAYLQGAKHQTSFYGLLAAEKAGAPFDPSLKGGEKFEPWRDASFAGSSLQQVVVLALSAGQLNLAERFMLQMAKGKDRATLGQIAAMLEELQQPHLGVMLGKQAAREGRVLPAPYYAIHPVAKIKHPVPTEMVLAIARRESEFDFSVVSGVGAEGLMQVMPATARQVAREIGVEHTQSKMLSSWQYNSKVGAAYLATLGAEFKGNVIMVSAGYNAGPSRPKKWMERFGDPRSGGMDIVDWIEHIAFRETRNYVMRVAESLPVYRARLGKNPLPKPFSKELIGSSVLPLSP